MMRRAVIETFDLPVSDDIPSLLPDVELTPRQKSTGSASEMFVQLVTGLYDIGRDDRRFRSEYAAAKDRAQAFHRLRAEYPVRREFSSYRLPEDANGPLREVARAVGVS